MTPPHTRFKFLSRNHLSHRSRHSFNRAEPQHSSTESIIPVHEDGLDSLDRPRNTSVDGLNQGLKPPEEPEFDCVDCTSSDSDHLSDEQASSTVSSFEAGDFAVGSPRHVKEGHVARQNVVYSTSIIYQTTIYMTPYQDASTPSSSSKPPTSTHTSTSITTFANSISQCNETLGLGTGCPLSTTTPQTFAQLSPTTSSSYTVYPTLSSSSDMPVTPTSDTPATTTINTSLQPSSGEVPSSNTVMVSSPSAQSTPAPATNSDPQSSPHMAAIVGGAIGAIALLVLLIFIAIWYRRKRRLSVTPFTLPSTSNTMQNESAIWLKSHSIGDAVRPSSGCPPSVQCSEACLVEHSGNRYPSFVPDTVSSHLPDDYDTFASVIALRQHSNGLEKPYPYPSRARVSDHYHRSSVESWVRQVVMEEYSREPSEVLPAYRSTKSVKSEKADDDDHYAPPSSYPPLP